MHSARLLRLLPLLAAGTLCAAPAPTLKDTFKDDFLIGVALNARQFNGEDAAATALIAREFNSATAENAMKWDSLEPKRGQFNFEQADRFVDYCRAHDLVVIGHNLCWHAQLPTWVTRPEPGQDQLTREVLLARLKNHVQTVARHFQGRVLGWDVVNEAIQDGNGEYRSSIFYRVIGKEYLALAFKWAHEADPDAELYYNDYNLDADDAKRARAVELVQYLREQGAPIHGIGLQGHYNLTTPTAAKIDETIQIFADLGLKVVITELDVEAIHDAKISGAIDAPTGGANPPAARPPRPRFFPTMETMQTKLSLTPAQVAAITPLVDHAMKEIEAAISTQEFHRIGEIREDTTEAIGKLLTAEQQAPLTALMTRPPGGAPVGPPPPPLTAEQQQELAQRYADIFRVFMKHRDAITRVTLWGLRDADSWRRRSSPLLFDEAGQPKPAYQAVLATGSAGQP